MGSIYLNCTPSGEAALSYVSHHFIGRVQQMSSMQLMVTVR